MFGTFYLEGKYFTEAIIPTIVVLSPKGGAGKTTTALVMSTQLAKLYPVTVIDADKNHPISRWATNGNTPASMKIIADADEHSIADRIDEAALETPFVVVDLPGSADKIAVMAVSRADFVVIPTGASEPDIVEAMKAIIVVRQHEKGMRRVNPAYNLPFAILLTQTNAAIKTRILRHVIDGLAERNVPMLTTQLHERSAYKSMLFYGQTLEMLDPAEVSNIPKAIDNAQALTNEVLEALRVAQSKEVTA